MPKTLNRVEESQGPVQKLRSDSVSSETLGSTTIGCYDYGCYYSLVVLLVSTLLLFLLFSFFQL